MQTCTCLLLFGAFAYTHSGPVTTLREDKKGANLTLKSIPEFTVKETSKNDNVATNKTVIGDNNIQQLQSTDETFTDFIQELVIILNTYNDDMFEDFVDIVDKEIKQYPHRIQNEFQNLYVKQSNLLMKKSFGDKRAVINNMVHMMKLLKVFDTNVRELLDYINFLYSKDAKKQFQEMLTDLKGYSAGYGNSRTKYSFARLIRKCVRATVFIHRHLNTNAKRKLKKHTDTFLKKIKEFYSYNTVNISDNIFIEDKTPKTSLKLNTTKTTAHIKEENKRIRVFRTETSETRQEDATVTNKTSVKFNSTKTTAHIKEKDKRIRVFRTETSKTRQEDPTITTKISLKLDPIKTDVHKKEENKRIRVFRTNENEAKQEDAAITTKISLKMDPIKTDAHKKEENKRIRVFRTNSNEAKQEDATTTHRTLKTTAHIKEENKIIRIFRIHTEPKQEDPAIPYETSKRGESNSQLTNITHTITNETATEVVMFFMTTEKPGIVYKSESKSKLVEKMLEENSTETKVTGQSTTTPGKRLTTEKNIRRSEKPPLPSDVLSVELFDRDRRRRSKKIHTRSSKFTTEPPELKEYLRKLRLLKIQLEELKSINEINHNSKRYKFVENNSIDEHETKDKIPSNKRKERKNFKKTKHSYEHESKVQTEKNKVDDTEKDVKQTNSVSKDRENLGRSVQLKDDDINHHSHKVIHKKKYTRSKSKKTTKATRSKDVESNGIDKHEIKYKKPSNKRNETKKLQKSKHRYKHIGKVQREKNKVSDSQDDVKITNIASEDEDVRHRSHKVRHKKKDTRSKSKKNNKEAETTTKPKNLLRSSESLLTAKDNAVNNKHAKSRLKPSKKVEIPTYNVSEEIKQSSNDKTAIIGITKDNPVIMKHAKSRLKPTKKAEIPTYNVSEEIKQNSNDETATKDITIVTEDNKNETIAHSLRRFAEAFPALFKENTLQGLYPAHLWD